MAEVVHRPGIGLAQPEGEIVSGSTPEPVELAEGGDELIEADASVQTHSAVGDGLREPADGVLAAMGEPKATEVGAGEDVRSGKEAAEAEALESPDGDAEPLHQATHELVGGGNGDLLADDRPHAGLERVKGAWGADTRPGL